MSQAAYTNIWKMNRKEKKKMNKSFREKKKKSSKLILIAMVVILAVAMSLSGCGNNEESNKEDSGKESSEKTWEFTDDCGRKVEVPKDLDQVIASGSLAQIFIYALAPDSLMASASKRSEDEEEYIPKKYLKLPEVGSFFGKGDLNYEEIAKMSPQLIIDVGEAKPSIKSDLKNIEEKTGIPAVHIDADFKTVDKAFTRLGELMGMEKQAEKLAAYSKDAYDQADKALKKAGKKKKVMYCTQEDGLNVLAKDSYHSQIVDMMADNVAVLKNPSSKGTGNEVNIEQMMKWDPEIILFAPGSYYDYAEDDPSWKTLSAIKADKYYEVPHGPYEWMGNPPSSNRVLGLLWITKLLYPKEADFDMKEKTKEYYDLFYHYDLSDKKYEQLLKDSILKM